MGKVFKWNGKQGKKSKEKEIEDKNCLYKKDVIDIIGKENWKEFSKWMKGQTSPVMSDGSCGYYSWDVEKFKFYYIDHSEFKGTEIWD